MSEGVSSAVPSPPSSSPLLKKYRKLLYLFLNLQYVGIFRAHLLSRFAAAPLGMMSGFFLTCRFGGWLRLRRVVLGGRGRGLSLPAAAEAAAGRDAAGMGGGGLEMEKIQTHEHCLKKFRQ